MGKEELALGSLQRWLDVSSKLRDELFCMHSGLLLEFSRLLRGEIGHSGKLLIRGNGGSASDSRHFSGEMAGRMLGERRPLGKQANYYLPMSCRLLILRLLADLKGEFFLAPAST